MVGSLRLRLDPVTLALGTNVARRQALTTCLNLCVPSNLQRGRHRHKAHGSGV